MGQRGLRGYPPVGRGGEGIWPDRPTNPLPLPGEGVTDHKKKPDGDWAEASESAGVGRGRPCWTTVTQCVGNGLVGLFEKRGEKGSGTSSSRGGVMAQIPSPHPPPIAMGETPETPPPPTSPEVRTPSHTSLGMGHGSPAAASRLWARGSVSLLEKRGKLGIEVLTPPANEPVRTGVGPPRGGSAVSLDLP